MREPFKAYGGEPRPAQELALVSGDVYYRKDWLSSYADTVRFIRVDGHSINNSRAYDEVYIAPGERELEVYYSWDMGARMGLAPALASYSSSQTLISEVLKLEAKAGAHYTVRMRPVFSGQAKDISSLNHVEFWIENEAGEVVSEAVSES
ncbi:MAG: hypothetical protein R3332_13600 [Pseudohongiellaceae bacterium]|nr:hypothetical protein [Pseudohongiellaceae bacterium]